ncbi:serpin family protein [Glycomyces terrestris]|uniref:Proteinase inhibitor I4 serpin n=1 Tax=Glycomyces terrestris TaxID=2493553 RepID=A0A426UTR3_9ACTN|nr:serpin family protein [Glycomyces terrestris]RRR96935.1 proteinase inhibitor I4 serpin [Glycomyces terrestris]
MATRERALERILTPREVAAANRLHRTWLEARAPLPVMSGFGVWPLLSVLATGAVGDTRSQLLTAAGLTPERAARIPAALAEAFAETESIRLAIAVWAGSRITLDPDWTAGLPVDAVGTLTGDTAADKAALDAWAARATRGLIDRMPVDLSQPVDLLLASALSVTTKWITPFRDLRRTFTTGPWSRLGPVRGLAATLPGDRLRVGDHLSVLTLPGDGDIDVLLGLGPADRAPGLVLGSLVATDPASLAPAADLAVGDRAIGVEVTEQRTARPQQGPEVDVETVRFDLASDLDLLDAHRALGLTLAADRDRARFDRMAAQPVNVSQARQSCRAVFSATGFEAAAVTAIAMARAAGVPKLNHRRKRVLITFDRPFAFLVRHRPTGLNLFAGWVDEPETA